MRERRKPGRGAAPNGVAAPLHVHDPVEASPRIDYVGPMGKKLEFAVAVLNGAVGDYLARTNNGLALPMELVQGGRAVSVAAAAGAAPSGRLAVFVHGLMSDESIWSLADGTTYGSRLATDVGHTPVYVRHNSGRAIAENGESLSALLTELVAAWPVPVTELLPIAHSQGGLVVRSACHVAAESGAPWLPLVRQAVYVATPHLGAPAERAGRILNRVLHKVPEPTTRLIAQIADLRSDGIKDLGDADLRAADRARRGLQLGLRDPRHPVPLLPTIRHHLVAGALSADPWIAALFGDSIVPVESATGGGRLSDAPLEDVRIFHGRTHVGLAHDPEVYSQIRTWCTS